MRVLHACTIVSKNYLPFARVLASSFREHHPEGRFFVLLVDRVDDYFDPAAEPFEVLEAAEVTNLPDPDGFLFKYTILESNTAIKPFLLEYLLDTYELPNLVYFDPDIRIYSSLDRLAATVEESSLVLTPHLDVPIDDAYHPGETAILQSGAYNLGFLAVRDCPATRKHLKWWQQRLYDQCVVRIEDGLFVDQKWMDLAPSLVEETTILRDPGYNVAYWNLHGRRVENHQGELRVNGEAPLVFFHFSGIEPENLERVSKHQDRFRLSEIGHAAELYRQYRDELLAAGYRECHRWPFAYGTFDNGVPIPASVRRSYLDLSPTERERFGNPFATAGDDSFWYWLNQPSARGELSRFLQGLYRQRPDLHARFPDPAGQDRRAFAQWIHEYGRHELKLASEFLHDLPAPTGVRQLSVQGLANRLRRLWRSPRAAVLKDRAKGWLGPERTARWKRRLGREIGPGPSTEARGTLQHPTRVLALPRQIDQPGINLIGYLQAETGMGEAARSLAAALEAADIPHALHSLDLNVLAPNRDDRLAARLTSDVENLPYGINLFVVNADQTPAVMDQVGAALTAGRLNLGFWLWELETLPPRFHAAFGRLHEVWTPSSFCVDAFSAVAPIPVRRVPLPVVPPPPRHDRAHFGLPENDFLFLYLFNFLSYFERKNPLGLVESFRRAFPRPEDQRGVRLVLKTSQSDFAPERHELLRAAIGDLPVTVLDGYYSAAEISSLIAGCNAYVSLHRSEGYGLTLAEAMYHGKSVIATGYSGNRDFFGINNGFPVRYELTRLAHDEGPYPAGARWADPDLDHAAEGLRQARVGGRDLEARNARGRQTVREELSHEAVGRVLRRAFEALLGRI